MLKSAPLIRNAWQNTLVDAYGLLIDAGKIVKEKHNTNKQGNKQQKRFALANKNANQAQKGSGRQHRNNGDGLKKLRSYAFLFAV